MINSLKAGLVSYWPLHEASGNRSDMTGAANTLTDTNTVTQNPGIQVQAAQFTAANSERLALASNALVQMGDIDFTFCFWAYMDSKPAAASWIIKFAATSGNYDYQIYYLSATDRWQAAVCRATDSAQTVTANTFGAAPLSTWQMVTMWHDATGDTLNIAVNATAPDSVATGGSLQAAGTADFNLGGYSGGNYINGRMAEVGLWKRVLTTPERLWLYNKGRGRSFPFDGRFSPAMLGRHTYSVGPRRSRLTGIAA